MRSLLALVPLTLAAACSTAVPPGVMTVNDLQGELCPNQTAVGTDEVLLQYLGSGGLLIGWRGSVVMTAPFFSNPGFLRVGLGMRLPIRPSRIEAGLPAGLTLDALLVGHSHYDHLMDVPDVLLKTEGDPLVYGSRTTRHLLAGDPRMADLLATRFRELDGSEGDQHHEGRWWPLAPGVRAMALRSGHAPHFWGIRMYAGDLDDPRTEPPTRAKHWREGPTYAFLIDLLDASGNVAVRLHIQDAASTAPQGYPPRQISSRPVDIAVVCVGGAQQVRDYPGAVLGKLAPKLVVLSHWEDFFRDPESKPRVVRGTDLEELLEDVAVASSSPWILPKPGVLMRLRACATREDGASDAARDER